MPRKLTQKELSEATGFTPIRSKPDTFKEWLEIIWGDFKMLILFGLLFLFAIIYTVRGCIGAVKPDLNVMLVSSQTIWQADVAERLEERLRPYVFDVNGDGVAAVNVSISAYFTNGTHGDEAAEAYQEKFFLELATGASFIIVCDDVVAKYLEYDDAYEPLTYFSSDLSPDLVGIKLEDTDIMEEDPVFLELLDGYRVVLRSFSKEGYNNHKLTRDECTSAQVFMENVIAGTITKPVD
ncbi:MAG: hypothetical protein IJC25_01920 [Clostridia bacterium]|nr:hypothetical protein [Clostridia bacterium]